MEVGQGWQKIWNLNTIIVQIAISNQTENSNNVIKLAFLIKSIETQP